MRFEQDNFNPSILVAINATRSRVVFVLTPSADLLQVALAASERQMMDGWVWISDSRVIQAEQTGQDPFRAKQALRLSTLSTET